MRSRTAKVLVVVVSGMLIAAVVLGAAAFTFFNVHTSHASPTATFHGKPRFYSVHHNASNAQIATAGYTNLAHFTSSFTYQGATYKYTMVGTNPALGSRTTTIPVTVIPLKVVFSTGHPLNGALKVQNTVASPLFQQATFESGKTQYGDAIQRAEFWQLLQAHNGANYHVLLGQPTIAPVQMLTVPANIGLEETASNGDTIGIADINWWDAQLSSIITAQHFSSDTLPIFLSYNVVLDQNANPNNCCIIGYHSANSSPTGLQSYAWASNMDAGIFPSADHIQDINPLSHEISEWYNDPFVYNTTPVWSVPSQPQYGCSNALETGDPLVGVAFYVNGYHPQDEAFFSWFARQSPSIGYGKRYTYLNSYSTFSSSAGC
ncbi:MAG: hypothetical protein ABI068_10055 [Ktedonobacterales bacterium]